ncbi:hypothetical protein BDN72DRAFT_873503 [Pluteus cervinus]|uniref:Uncharacterized protein n=1 Tax=Pluteus cervinus TaxID=181527 RepID=A0ACD3BHL5_9AGAR|nr:hypothetical protein BDN72DRAFT_873503 [Pluteus cervinus]
MSVATKNPFALLDDDNSESSPPAASKAAPAPAPATRGQQKSRGGPASRAGNYYARGGGTRSAPKDQQPAGAEDSTAPERQKRPEGRGRGGRGGGRGGNRDGGNRDGGNREGGRGGRRPFDRHSQTGKTDSDKKLHQSWGGDDGNTELKTEQAARNDAAAEGVASTEWGASTTNDWGTGGGGGGGDWSTNNAEPAAAESWGGGDAAPAPEADKPEREGRPRREREPEEEDNTLTLDQYIAQQKEKENLPKLEVRRANDGTDENWKDVKPLEKNEDDETYFIGKSKSAPKARAKKEEKVYLEIDARFERPDRGGRGRGGRGGDRDRGRGRGRGGYAPRGGRQTGPALNVDDEVAFPSLS